MKKRIGILTSGGDCPGLNATIRGVTKSSYSLMDCDFYGIRYGFHGLIHNDIKKMSPRDFSGILAEGGTILGSYRTPFKKMRVVEKDGIDKVAAMIKNYKKHKLDCLICLGGNGTHKNANLLREEGLNVIALPKTIDNDIYGTDITFGYQTAVDTATEIIDRIHTTAASHDRVMVVELMGNKAGWLALYAGIAGGVNVILIPELPYKKDSVVEAVRRHREAGNNFTIVAVAEGAKSQEEAEMSKKAFKAYLAEAPSSAVRVANLIAKETGFEVRTVIPGHILRGGSPTAFDRTLASKIGAFGAKLIAKEQYGVGVSVVNNNCAATPLQAIAGLTKTVPVEDDLIETARLMGISLGQGLNFG